MSMFYFCPACGSNLTYISNQRLKCYKCEKYFTENFICRCHRDKAFKFSAEITAPNKVKCYFCGKAVQVPANLEPPYIDKHRGRAGSGSLGSWDGQVGSFPTRRVKEKTMEPKMEKPEVDYVSENREQIVIRFPGHNSLDQIRCEIVNKTLEVKSLLVDFLEKFPLPYFPVKLETELRNYVLDIRFKKEKGL